jgi:hypothetical protein
MREDVLSGPRQLKVIVRKIGQLRALAFFKRNMRIDGLALEAVDQIGKTIALRIEIWSIDLVNIPGENDLGVVACPRDHGLHLVRGKILRLINNEEHIGKASSPDISERANHQLFVLHHFVYLLEFFILFGKLVLDVFEIIPERLHIRIELAFDIPGQVADVLIA